MILDITTLFENDVGFIAIEAVNPRNGATGSLTPRWPYKWRGWEWSSEIPTWRLYNNNPIVDLSER